MSDASDEFSAFDLSEFTEEDFKQIDADIAGQVVNINGGPSLTIELELEPLRVDVKTGDTPKPPGAAQQRTVLSPYEEFRPGGVLSVTDLAAPSWCEVQFDYGLRQKRSRPIASRPKTFRSAQGKEISVQENVAVKNDEITKQGKAIHKELEREIRLEELQVEISSNEERWALRLTNMLVCLKILLSEGKIREMPVFGFLQNQIIVGIIDEIDNRQQRPRSADTPHPSPPKKARRTPTPSQNIELLPNTLSDTGFSRGPILQNQEYSTPSSQQYTFHLVDTKTRRSNTLPLPEDTLSSRIQLMLYHRLLKELMSVSRPFDFATLWERLHLRSSETFSIRFLVQAGLLVENGLPSMTSLDDLTRAWVEMVQQAQLVMIDPNLTIVYRLQPSIPRWNSKGKARVRAHDTVTEFSISQEERDIARAIEASLSDLFHSPASDQDTTSQPPADVSARNVISDDMDITIIGKNEFIYNGDFLDEHLARILRWWYGHRKPEGVSLQNSRRCFSCEYESQCEWREQKATEFREGHLGRDRP